VAVNSTHAKKKYFSRRVELENCCAAKDEANDDCLPEAREIMGLNLNTDLVVLSTCDTARGSIGASVSNHDSDWRGKFKRFSLGNSS
jgi:CHAT domain-containing protein